METNPNSEPQSSSINEVQLVLAEKRTSLAVLRTGIAVSVIPLSIISFLIATSKTYNFSHVAYLLVPLLIVCTLMGGFGFYLIVRSAVKVHRYDGMITALKQQHSNLKQFF
jgi:uncharacterized membrane protein YkgB